jgi:mono/diheme cytochrome c family protein
MTVPPLALLAAAASLLLTSPARADAPRRTPELLEKGRSSFAKNCASCHGPKGEGDGVAAKALNPRPRNLVTEPLANGPGVEKVFETLDTGRKGTAMIAFKHLPEDERWALAYYVLSLKDPARTK